MLEQKGKYKFEELPDDLPDCKLSVEEEAVGKVSCEELVAFIKTLSEARKQAVILKGVYSLTNLEIAGILGISEAAVRRRLSDAYCRFNDFIRKREK